MKKSMLETDAILSMIRKIGNVLYVSVIVCLVLIAAVVALSALKIPGSFKLLTVQSGSMEPVIKTGSLVIVQPQSTYRIGDIITTSKPADRKVSVTHRIFEAKMKDNEVSSYVTKGDANKTADTEERLPEQVMGKVLLSIPHLGYPVAFAKTQTGLIVLVVIPGTLIVYSEFVSMKNEVGKLLTKRKKSKLNPLEKIELSVGQEEIVLEQKTKKWWHIISKKI